MIDLKLVDTKDLAEELTNRCEAGFIGLKTNGPEGESEFVFGQCGGSKRINFQILEMVSARILGDILGVDLEQ